MKKVVIFKQNITNKMLVQVISDLSSLFKQSLKFKTI